MNFKIAGIVAGLAAAAVAPASLSYAINFDFNESGLFLADRNTGTATLIGNTGVNELNSLTWAEGQLVAARGLNGGSLYSINTSTGAATLLTNITGLGLTGSIRGLAYRNGVYFAVASDVSTFTNDRVVRITGGVAEVVSVTTGFQGLQALTFADDGTLYGWDTSQGLVTIDPISGAVTDLNGSAGTLFALQTLFFDGGQLYGYDTTGAYSINATTGSATLLAAGTNSWRDFRGAEAVPEPMTMAVLGAAGLLVARRRRVRR